MKWTKGFNLLSRRRSLVFSKWTKELFIRASMRFAQRLTVLAYYFFWFSIFLPWVQLSTVLSKILLRKFYVREELIIFSDLDKTVSLPLVGDNFHPMLDPDRVCARKGFGTRKKNELRFEMEDRGLGKMVVRNGKVFCEFRGGKHFLFMGMELYRVGGRKEALEWIKEIHDVYDRYYENLFESITDEEWSR